MENKTQFCLRHSRSTLFAIALVLISLAAVSLPAASKDSTPYGEPLILNLPFPEGEVTQVVEDVVQDGIIRGSKEFNKDEYVSGATAATSTRAFKDWTEGGKVYYKLRLKALDPLNFKNTNDVGTLAVRYVVQPQGEKNTVIRIDAVFVEDFRHVTHPSNGSVETAEYKDIHDRLDAIESMKAQTVEAEKQKQEQLSKRSNSNAPNTPLAQESSSSVSHTAPVQTATVLPESSPATATPKSDLRPDPGQTDAGQTDPRPAETRQNEASLSLPPSTVPQTLEQRVQDLRRQVERLVKAPGAPLKSAPFHTASTLQSLAAGTEVLIVVSTPYWLGVETHDGRHGWMLRDELELLP